VQRIVVANQRLRRRDVVRPRLLGVVSSLDGVRRGLARLIGFALGLLSLL
jgi:hypothetical protein